MSTQRLSRFANPVASTGSSAKKSEMEELLTCRDTPHFADGVISMLFGVNLAVGRILKSQEVLLDKIESIAQRMEILEKEVSLVKAQIVPNYQEMILEKSSQKSSEEVMKDYMTSLESMLDVGISADIICYETL